MRAIRSPKERLRKGEIIAIVNAIKAWQSHEYLVRHSFFFAALHCDHYSLLISFSLSVFFPVMFEMQHEDFAKATSITWLLCTTVFFCLFGWLKGVLLQIYTKRCRC